ncbi:MAG: hypothetical protein ACT4O1_06060 [Gemmatimonadota bacterium]
MITTLLLSVITAAGVTAPVSSDGAWLAWQGCWRAVEDAENTLVCIVPDGAGARMVRYVGGAVESETRIIADGVARPFSDEGCTGTQQARWSEDEQRLFLLSDMTCGERTQRKVSGVMAILGTEWLNVQAITSGENTSTRSARYAAANENGIPKDIARSLRANRLARETARSAAGSLIDLADVQEAVAAIHADAVMAWLTEAGQAFDLTGKKLVSLADAGVPASVIDVLVAVSNPEHFAVRTRTERVDDRGRRTYGYDPCHTRPYDPWMGPIGYSHDYGYNRCYRYGRSFSPWGYGSGWGYHGAPVIVVRNPTTPNPSARVTRKGYSSGNSSSSSTARENSPSPKPTGSTTSTKGSNGSDSGGSSSSGSSTGRTAKPRT